LIASAGLAAARAVFRATFDRGLVAPAFRSGVFFAVLDFADAAFVAAILTLLKIVSWSERTTRSEGDIRED
jgi:hypothetical protein